MLDKTPETTHHIPKYHTRARLELPNQCYGPTLLLSSAIINGNFSNGEHGLLEIFLHYKEVDALVFQLLTIVRFGKT
jgi:hypothetical protein